MQRAVKICAAVIALSMLGVGLVNAQSNPAPAPPPPASSDLVTMNMRDADIRTLIQWIADQTGKNMVVHHDVQGKVTVLSAKPVTREEAYRVFLSVLQVHGFAAIETPEAVKIVPANIATQGGLPYRNGNSGDMVTQVFKATNVAAPDLAQMLRPLVSKEAIINADANTNMLLIADHANNIAQLQELVQKMDRAGGSEMELVHLQYANSKEILASLNALFPSQGGGAGGQGGGQAALPLSMSADDRSNRILLSGDPVKRARVKTLIHEMDSPLTGEGNTQVFYLQYANAKEVAPILKSLAQSVLKDQKDKETSFSVEPSESANALVVNAPPGLLNTLKGVVEKLDVRRAQVLVEALIVEVNSDFKDDLGVYWATGNLSNPNGSTGVAAVNTLGTNLSLATPVLDTTGAVIGATPGTGVTLGYITKGALQAAVRALSTSSKANILSTPTVVAIDNEPASLLVGQNVPFITGQATSAAATTTNPFTTIERKDIGISLEVTPRINQGNTITLEIKQKVESIAPAVANATDLVTNKREINTRALINDDQVLVLGGLISDSQTDTAQKVPILGDLPLIGGLFRGKSHERERNNLMVFIHPVILRNDDQIAHVTQAHYGFMQGVQDKSVDEHPTTEKNPEPAPRMEDFDTFSPLRHQSAQ